MSKNMDREFLLCVDKIWKIEIIYGTLSNDGKNLWKTFAKDGMNDPNCVKGYILYIANETHLVTSNPDCPVMQEIEKIYMNAIKG
jgi:hypothetical protein